MGKKLFFTLIHTFILINLILAGTTGKIAGLITDAETGEPLAGVNVLLEGTNLGSATDLDGYFVILNVPPGRFNLRVQYIGYREYQITDLVVKMDLTSRMDIQLEAEVLETEVVVVEAKRPVITRDISNSQMNLEAAAIEILPVQTVNQVLTLQAGIERDSRGEGIVVRRGGVGQTVFQVDGLSTNDERAHIPYTTLSLSSVEEITVQTGGLSAEYGDARSGLVNVVTKEGGRDRYNGTAIFNYRPQAAKNFGPSIYRRDSFFNRPFLDPAVCWTGTNNGAWDEATRQQYPNFEGWNAISERTLQDDNPQNDLTPQGARQLFEWQRRRKGDINKPDYILDMGFGGPMPFVSEELGNLRFYASHFRERDMFIFPLSYDSFSENKTQIKFTSDLAPSMKLNLSGSYGEINSVSPYDWKTTPTGRVLRDQGEIANLLSRSSGASILYMPGYYSPTDIYRTSVGLKFTHAINSRLFYDVKLQYKTSKYNTHKTADRNLDAVYEPVPGYFVDEAPYGYYGLAVSGVEGTSLGGWMNLGRDRSRNDTYSVEFDLTSQINPFNQLKTGIRYIYNDFNIVSTTENPKDTWSRSMIYRVFPYRLGAYIQDKLEFEGFIANLGLRLDYSHSNTRNYQLDTYDRYFGPGYGSTLEEQVEFEDSKPDWNISPRLGISHPITEQSKLYFNYNHFHSEPASSFRFRLQRENDGLVTHLGNPDLNMEKTISYELGYEHNLFEEYLIKVAAYYKNVTEQPASIRYRGLSPTVQVYRYENNNYEDIRGLELTLYKRVGNWVRGFINYTYDVRTYGYFGYREYWEDPTEMKSYIKKTPTQERLRPRPYARANINIQTPSEFGPKFMGISPLGDWYLNILADWKTGEYYIWEIAEGVEHEVQWRDWYNVDLRLTKSIHISGWVTAQFYMDITNVFNFKHMDRSGSSGAGFSDNRDWDNYLESLHFSWENGDQNGDDNIGDYRPPGVALDRMEANPDNDPEIAARNEQRKKDKSYIDMPDIRSFTFLNPRNVIFGLRLNF